MVKPQLPVAMEDIDKTLDIAREFSTKVGARNRITIPAWVCDDLDIEQGDVVDIEVSKQ